MECASTAVVERINRGVVDVVPDVDEVGEVTTEDGAVLSLLGGETFGLAVGMRHINLLVLRSEFVGCIEDVARLVVHAIDVGHLTVALAHLSLQLSVEVVDIESCESVAVAGDDDVRVGEGDGAHGFLSDILLHLVLHYELCHGRERVDHIYAHVVLMAVHGKHSHLRRVGCHGYARNISVSVERDVHLACLSRLDVETIDSHL